MQILEKAEGWEDGWKAEETCPNCQSRLRIFLDDVKRNTDYTGDFTSWYYDCPVCLTQPDLPRHLWSTINRLKRR